MFTQWSRFCATGRGECELRAARDFDVFRQRIQQSAHAVDIVAANENRSSLFIDQCELNVARALLRKGECATVETQFVIGLFAQP